jgi:predicted RNase H-like nuclease (RuvC/YqgF family)
MSSQPTLSNESALNKRTIEHINNQLKMDELRYEVKRLRTVNNFQVNRIDELHDQVFKMEEKFRAMAEELRSVRSFSIDLLVDHQNAVNEAIKAKFDRDRETAEQFNRELDYIFQEAIEWKNEEFCESDDLWKVIMESSPFEDLDPSNVDAW